MITQQKDAWDARTIISKRKQEWEDGKDIENDRDFVRCVVDYLLESPSLQAEIQANPDYLIELCFHLVDKNKKTIPFFFNDVQRDLLNRIKAANVEYKKGTRLYKRFLVLKGRQQGITSAITAYQLACTITNSNFEGFTAADEDANTSAIFENKAKYIYSMLPEKLKPTEKFNNRKQLLFEQLHSSWEIKTASKNMGRSRTINFFHGSEAAFWRDGISGIQAGLGEAMTKDAVQILESTANGYNEFKDLWDSLEWENCFYTWWKTSEYRLEFESEPAKKNFLAAVNSGTEWIFQRCRWLIDKVGLDYNQVYWYYNKWKGYLVKDTLLQEYPCSEDEAFLASGSCIFNKEKIMQRKQYLIALYNTHRPTRGDFLITWNNPDMMDYPIAWVWQDNANGNILLYHQPEKGHPYTIGGDTKGEGSDWFSGTVRDNHSGQRCATLHMQGLQTKPYTAQIWALGMYYHQAMIAIEVNFNTYPVELLTDWHYPRQYMREKTDSISKEVKKQFGWRTDGNTRPLIIEREITEVEENIDNFWDIPTLDEMLSFVQNKDGKYDAEDGKHDDLLFSDMISVAAGTQQRRDVELMQAPTPLFLMDDDGDGTHRRRHKTLGGFFD